MEKVVLAYSGGLDRICHFSLSSLIAIIITIIPFKWISYWSLLIGFIVTIAIGVIKEIKVEDDCEIYLKWQKNKKRHYIE